MNKRGMADHDVDKITSTLKTYYKLCLKVDNRSVILKDSTFISVIVSFLNDHRIPVMINLVKILFTLTERSEDAYALNLVPGLEDALAAAAERPFSPSLIHNLLVISSRIKTAKTENMFRVYTTCYSYIKADNYCDNKSGDGRSMLHRKFVTRKSKQLVYEFEELWEDFKSEVERKVLAKKGVISIYFNPACNRAVIRTILTVEAQEITELLFDCGCEMVTQIVKIDGMDEYFKSYASERQKKNAIDLPDYLDDLIDVSDPNSRIVTNEYSMNQKKNGWFNSLSSLVKGSLW
uniref:Armadillo repeat-containing protein 1 n=1 Tax=Heterorhabditis bacteriophora TaxID=37862 RepID=A0A1I7WYA4_HETBA